MSEAAPEPGPIREWRDVDPALFAEIVAEGQPAVIRGAAADWPMVRRFREGPQSLVDYLIGFDTGALVTTAIAHPSQHGRLVYKEGVKELNHGHSDELLPNVLKGLIKLMDSPEPPGVWIGGMSAPDQLPGIEAENRSPIIPDRTWANFSTLR